MILTMRIINEKPREEKGQNTFEEVLISAAHEYTLLRGINIIMWLPFDLQAQS